MRRGPGTLGPRLAPRGRFLNLHSLEPLAESVAPLAAARPAPSAAKRPVLPAAERALGIEYAIRDVVAPARELEKQGHKVLKLNIGDPIAYGFKPPAHLLEALHQSAVEGHNGYSPS